MSMSNTVEKNLEQEVPTVDLVSQISQKIEFEMLVKKSYLKKGYSLRDLSKDANIHIYLLSAFINKKKGLRFNDFINQYRVDSCKELMKEGSALLVTLEALASMCGFSNRNTFISAFKKFTGITPSEYIRSISS